MLDFLLPIIEPLKFAKFTGEVNPYETFNDEDHTTEHLTTLSQIFLLSSLLNLKPIQPSYSVKNLPTNLLVTTKSSYKKYMKLISSTYTLKPWTYNILALTLLPEVSTFLCRFLSLDLLIKSLKAFLHYLVLSELLSTVSRGAR